VEKFGRFFGSHMGGTMQTSQAVGDDVQSSLDGLVRDRKAVAMLMTRGIGSARPDMAETQFTHWRRRFMMLGQTLDGMRVWDIIRTVELLPEIRGWDGKPIEIHARGDMAVNALLASVFTDDDTIKFDLSDFPESFAGGPDFLNIMKITDLPELKASHGSAD
jgi:hypothetical protein